MGRPKGSKNRPKLAMPDVSEVYRRPKMKTVAELIEARKKAHREDEKMVAQGLVVAVVIILAAATIYHYMTVGVNVY